MMAKEGLPFVVAAMIAAVAVLTGWFITASAWTLVFGLLLVVVALFFVYFFRDPERTFPEGSALLVSPADGKIMAIKSIDSYPFLNAPAIQISIFLSVFDVHINRIPCDGVVDYVKYRKGKFIEAFKEESSEINEQNEIGITLAGGHKIVLKQIAGILARRIVCHLREGQSVRMGQRFGMIRFGSRTDLIVPADTEIVVQKNEHVKGGSTIIGRLSMGKTTSTADSEKSNAQI